MPLAKIKTEEERARLDAIFAEIEAAERGELFETETPEAHAPSTNAEQRLESQDVKQIVGNAKCMLKDDAFKTKWERVLAKTLIKVTEMPDELGKLHAELNVLRNFVNAVERRLENAESAARQQDNHHYYKIFAEGVKGLLEKLREKA